MVDLEKAYKEEDIKTETTQPEIDKSDIVPGLRVSGEMVEKFEDKHFTILSTNIVNWKDEKTQNTTAKVVLSVVVAENGAIMDYWVNLASKNTLTDKFGYRLSGWLNKTAEWRTEPHTTGKERKVYLFVKEDKEGV